jgi:hypothetical protein
MEDISSADKLKDAIQLLETEQAEKWQLLKKQSLYAVEIFKPANLLKNAAKELVSSPRLLENLLGTIVGLATGFLTKKIITGSSVNIARKLLGSVLQFGVTTIATQNTDSIKSFGRFLFQRILNRNGVNYKKHGIKRENTL